MIWRHSAVASVDGTDITNIQQVQTFGHHKQLLTYFIKFIFTSVSYVS